MKTSSIGNAIKNHVFGTVKQQAEDRATSEAETVLINTVTSKEKEQPASPLLDKSKHLKTKALFGEDVRAQFKGTVRRLLTKNYKDIVIDDSNQHGKSGQVLKTTKSYLVHQLMKSLQSLSEADQNTLGIKGNVEKYPRGTQNTTCSKLCKNELSKANLCSIERN